MNLPQSRLTAARMDDATGSVSDHETKAPPPSSLYSPEIRFRRDWPGIGTLALRPSRWIRISRSYSTGSAANGPVSGA
ncbi:hypothetical protein CUR86_08090 [Salinicola acroporae]|uniref:Uncharacterized protein n=1 Tax=Salinicola acroporae TaxID=1541440 RepID=A0ABT6I422_9GAMM|nr:hypothetical protein [Salinicola acroporae]